MLPMHLNGENWYIFNGETLQNMAKWIDDVYVLCPRLTQGYAQ